jgi:hypothetical protein
MMLQAAKMAGPGHLEDENATDFAHGNLFTTWAEKPPIRRR